MGDIGCTEGRGIGRPGTHPAPRGRPSSCAPGVFNDVQHLLRYSSGGHGIRRRTMLDDPSQANPDNLAGELAHALDMLLSVATDERSRLPRCQIASKRDPLFASNSDPFWR